MNQPGINRGICRLAGSIVLFIIPYLVIAQRSFHVAKNGKPTNIGTIYRPLPTIMAAARLAQCGDSIIVHQGVYRERIDPPRPGCPNKPIVYMAAKGERVVITGSEIANNRKRIETNIFLLALPNKYFRDYNPFSEEIKGDWFDNKGWKQHTGTVYVDGSWLRESQDIQQLQDSSGYWFATVDQDSTRIWINFGNKNPDNSLVEISVRPTVFYPSRTGINYITVSGFILQHAATNWAPPTAGQVGLIGTNWSKGWIIEDIEIAYSRCVGITLGKYSDSFDNKSATAEGYVATVKRALEHGWNQSIVGSHIVRRNHIHHCEQAGIAGSFGCAFSVVDSNTIHDIHMQRSFSGAEQAAIKFHGAVDMVISSNTIFHNNRGIWLDWMAQGTRVTSNTLSDHDDWDLFLEVNHGPILVDHNVMLSPNSQRLWSQGVAYVRNIIGGRFEVRDMDGRETPVLFAHDTKIKELRNNPSGDLHFLENIFMKLSCRDDLQRTILPTSFAGNIEIAGTSNLIKMLQGGEIFSKRPFSTRQLHPAIVPEQDFLDNAGQSIDFDAKSSRQLLLHALSRLKP